MLANGRCSACHAAIAWCKNYKTGKAMPVDPIPVDDGNVWVHGLEGDTPLVHVAGKGRTPPVDQGRYKSHFATCPNANEFRRNR